ncbi:MAG: hypothetical protein H0W83_09015 [Planctomycetes bacterium]|nr:hypothetical protein [Planctomycetota bacterium]
MRLPTLVLCSLLLAACQGDRPKEKHHDPVASGPKSVLPPHGTNGILAAQALSLDRASDRISARIRLENTSDLPVGLKNLGDTLTGFRVRILGRDYSADVRRREGAYTAASLTEIPAHTQVELDLRWTLEPRPRVRDYAYDILVGNLWQADKRLPDVTIAVPGAGRDDDDGDEGDAKPAEEKPADGKPPTTY